MKGTFFFELRFETETVFTFLLLYQALQYPQLSLWWTNAEQAIIIPILPKYI